MPAFCVYGVFSRRVTAAGDKTNTITVIAVTLQAELPIPHTFPVTVAGGIQKHRHHRHERHAWGRAADVT